VKICEIIVHLLVTVENKKTTLVELHFKWRINVSEYETSSAPIPLKYLSSTEM